jgi:hypothetical protein
MALLSYSGFDDSAGFFPQDCHMVKSPASAKALLFEDSETARHSPTMPADELCGNAMSRDTFCNSCC